MDIEQIFATTGALPQTYRFNVQRTTPFLLYITGSCYSTLPNVKIGASVFIDGDPIGEVWAWANEKEHHIPLPAQLFVLKMTLGEHTLELRPLGTSTISDTNDFWSGAQLFFSSLQPFVWKTTGPLPKTMSFSSNVLGPAVMFLSGTLWARTPSNTAISVALDGKEVARSRFRVGEGNTHHAFPAVMVPVNLDPGPHELKLFGAFDVEVTDANDNFTVAVLY